MKKVKREASIAMLSAVAFLVAAVSWGQGDDTSTPRLLDSSSGGDWAGYGRTFGEQHFSPLTQINDSNVGGLKLSLALVDFERDPDPVQRSVAIRREIGERLLELGRAAGEHGGEQAAFGVEVVEKQLLVYAGAPRYLIHARAVEPAT